MSNYTQKSYAKVNIFLKIVGKQDGYHLLASRFAKVYSLFDTISFVPSKQQDFVLEGNFGCKTQQNTIYKAYEALNKIYNIQDIFKHYKVVVKKQIPEFAGLGGGSSNAGVFLNMVNQIAHLNIPKDTLSNIGLKVGADVPFFVYDYDSANVQGIGQIVTKFDEPKLDITTYTPKIKCSTKEIFNTYSQQYNNNIDTQLINKLLSTKSKDIVQQYDIFTLNDLYKPALQLNPNLTPPQKNSFFSGSGSSFFVLNLI
jgi:4-diphosphocytidyl-2-C-methyl-D-erythritol kinase